MPIYEYECATCGLTIEALQRLSDPVLSIHEGCGGALSKRISSPRTRVKVNDGLTGSTHSSILRSHENRTLEAERKKKKPGPL